MCRALEGSGKRIGALKPIMSGYNEEAMDKSDAGILLAALGAPVTQDTVSVVSPWRFEPPISPDMGRRPRGCGLSILMRLWAFAS